MQITVTYQYTAQEIPPRCRNVRPVRHTTTTDLTIAEITRAEAPIAIREVGRDFNHTGKWGRYTRSYRWWEEQLWVPYLHQAASGQPYRRQRVRDFQQHPHGFRMDSATWDYSGHLEHEPRRALLQDHAREVLFIDGLRYTTIGEPRYVIMTFGLGGNHGLGHGTDLMTSTSYNSNISYRRYFRIDQYAAALAETERIALARGDTKALPVTKQRPTRFTIHIPEAVRLTPQQEHGEGDPFLNQMEGMIAAVKEPAIAGLLGLSLALRSTP